jgi:hypothetical protein
LDLKNFLEEYIASYDNAESFYPTNLIKFSNFEQYTSFVGGNYGDISPHAHEGEAYAIQQATQVTAPNPANWHSAFVDIIKERMQTMEDILSATRTSGQDVLFYKIEKRDMSGNIVQNIYIPRPDPEEHPKITYIDTQVKYGKKYNYQIHAFTAIVGTKYRYVFSNSEEANALATQVGYATQRAEDIIYSARYDPNTSQFIGDAYNSVFIGEDANDKLVTVGAGKIVQSPLKQSEIKGIGTAGSLEIAQYKSQTQKDAALAGDPNYENVGIVASVDTNTPAGQKDEDGEVVIDDSYDPNAGDNTGTNTGGTGGFELGAIVGSGKKSGEGATYEAVLEEEANVYDMVYISNYRLYTRTSDLDEVPNATIPAGPFDSNLGGPIAGLTKHTDYNAHSSIFGTPALGLGEDGSGGGDSGPQQNAPGGSTEIGTSNMPGAGGTGFLGSMDQTFDDPGMVCEDQIADHEPPPPADIDPIQDPHDKRHKLGIVKAFMYPTFQLKKVLFYEEEHVVVTDFPPFPPNVNFDPYHDVKNVLLITLENQTGDREEIPVNVMRGDSNVFDTMRLAQKKHLKLPNGNFVTPKIRYKSDDFPVSYQIFRIRGTKPNSYADFGNALYQTLNTNIRTGINDLLETNVKYYYMFRSIDPQGSISNPSPVYEVEMIENSGVSYPIINTVTLGTKTKESEVRSFNRYMKIDAAYLQKVVNESESGITDTGVDTSRTPILGMRVSSDLGETVWNYKKFKFRVKSKNTCRVVDFNVKFKTEHDEVSNLIDPCND